MSNLEKHRRRIDEIDQELVRLLDERASIARAVGQTKAEGGLNTYDPGRQRGVLERALTRSSGSFPGEGLQHVFREVLSACLNLQKPLRVGFLGPAATFSHQAAIREFGHSVRFENYESIREVFQALEGGLVDHAVVPIENSTGGAIHDTLDAFLESSGAMICSEVLLKIRQSLLARVPLDRVRQVYSHRQGFVQCSQWLKKNLPGAELVEVPSTTRGMEEARTKRNAAAIGSTVAAELYGLRVIVEGIEDHEENATRFLVLAHRDSRASGDDKTTLAFGVGDGPGALYNVLKVFADLGVNMSKIESRPSRRNAWEYMFFVDVDGHRTDARITDALGRMQKICAEVRVLGSYPRDKGGS